MNATLRRKSDAGKPYAASVRSVGGIGPFDGLEAARSKAWRRSSFGKALILTVVVCLLGAAQAEPFIVTKTKALTKLFGEAKLHVTNGAVFVDHFDGRWRGPHALVERKRDFSRRTPGLEATTNWYWGTHGGYVSHLDNSHTCPDWESILKLGVPGIAARARRRRLTAQTERERIFLGCVVEAYEAMARMFDRWAECAAATGNAGVAETMHALAQHEPRTLREALQLMIVYDLCQNAEGEDVRSQGLFDRLYIDFYRQDLASGRETRASAKRLVGEMFGIWYRQGHPNGKNIGLGGYGRDGRPVWNELTEICFELHYELNRVNPKLTFRYGVRTPDDQLAKVARCVADGRTSIVFLNEEISFESFRRRGKRDGDAADAVLIGCYEPGIQGREVIASMSAWLNMVKPFEGVLNNGKGFDGYPIGPACAMPTTYAAFEAAYFEQLRALAETALAQSRRIEQNWWDINPSPIMSGAFRDAVENATDAYCGGMKYNSSGVMCAGLASVADTLAAVRYLVEERKACTMRELAEALKADWAGYEQLRLLARRAAPKWGNNDDRVDLLGKKVYDFLAHLVNTTPNGHGGNFQAGFWSIDNDLTFGRLTAATADGRHAGETLSRNNSATAGCGREGPTALMLSAAKLDQAESPDGFIFDLLLPASAVHADNGAHRVAQMLRAFAKSGGHCIHINCFDSATLRDAQAHPEKYPDLQVRVCGWNVLWRNLSRAEQNHFIATAAAQE